MTHGSSRSHSAESPTDDEDRRLILRAYRTTLWRAAGLWGLLLLVGLGLGLALSPWVALVVVPPVAFVAFLAATFWVQARRFRRPGTVLDAHLLGTARKTFELRGYREASEALERCIDRRSTSLPPVGGGGHDEGR